jgi:hypothetical protein
MQLPATVEGKQGKCPSCNAVVTVANNGMVDLASLQQQPIPEQPVRTKKIKRRMLLLLGISLAVGGACWGAFTWKKTAERKHEREIAEAKLEKAMDEAARGRERYDDGKGTILSAIRRTEDILTAVGPAVGLKGRFAAMGAIAINTEYLFRELVNYVDDMYEFEYQLENLFGGLREQGFLQDSLIKEVRAQTKARIEAHRD